jgi:hypothetical protein
LASVLEAVYNVATSGNHKPPEVNHAHTLAREKDYTDIAELLQAAGTDEKHP